MFLVELLIMFKLDLEPRLYQENIHICMDCVSANFAANECNAISILSSIVRNDFAGKLSVENTAFLYEPYFYRNKLKAYISA